MIVFLGLHGVLYENKITDLFGVKGYWRFTRFENVMRDFPDVDIVMIMDKREHLTLQQFRTWFTVDIASRIIGCTAITPDIGKNLFAQRECEILDWLKTHERASEQWVAVDNAIWHFTPPRNYLIACKGDVGFVAGVATELRQRLTINTVSNIDKINISKMVRKKQRIQSMNTILMRGRIKDWLPF